MEYKSQYGVVMQNGQEEKYRRFKIDPHNSWNLNAREKQYRIFLFYKYFYANDMPLIVTEGKTDVLYLKAALKNFYKDYPNLVEKINDKFTFKIKFFRRSKRMQYFFNITADGADTLENIYNHFIPSKDGNDYYGYLFKKSEIQPKNPVILIFDNEQVTNKPLRKLKGHAKLSERQKAQFNKKLYCELIENGNLFVLTHQLQNGKSECEIEDLFDQSTLCHIINGRSFSR